MTDLLDAFRRSQQHFGRVVDAVPDDRWTAPTPCTDWNVRALLNHVVYEELWVTPLMRDATIEEVGDRFDGDVLRGDPKAAWRSAAADARAAVDEDGALQRIVNVSWGQISATEYLTQVFMEHLIHGWDLARGIGADDTLDPELVEFAMEPAERFTSEFGSAGIYAARVETGPDADPQTKLLALLGRAR